MGEAKKKSEAKQKDMQENPEKYENKDDLILAVKYMERDGKKYMAILLAMLQIQELNNLIGEVGDAIHDRKQYIKMAAANQERAKNHIITPGEKQPANGGIKL